MKAALGQLALGALTLAAGGCHGHAPAHEASWQVPAPSLIHDRSRPPRVVAKAPEPRRAMSVAEARAKGARVFRNTYYYFPRESDFTGGPVPIRDSACGTIARVPERFYRALCVQGSGQLSDGRTVSYARNQCDCARACFSTGQQICFSALHPQRFPWGRGAMGIAITPMRTLAVDSGHIPLGEPVYIPEFVGVPMEPPVGVHDGCFIAQDRGSAVRGEHLDVFTGDARAMARLNQRVPSNQGVTVVVGYAPCEYLRRKQGR